MGLGMGSEKMSFWDNRIWIAIVLMACIPGILTGVGVSEDEKIITVKTTCSHSNGLCKVIKYKEGKPEGVYAGNIFKIEDFYSIHVRNRSVGFRTKARYKRGGRELLIKTKYSQFILDSNYQGGDDQATLDRLAYFFFHPNEPDLIIEAYKVNTEGKRSKPWFMVSIGILALLWWRVGVFGLLGSLAYSVEYIIHIGVRIVKYSFNKLKRK